MAAEPGTGTLYVVATPIGNLGDMTFRAVDVLRKVKLIAAEDTRHSKKLLSHYQITTPLISCHEHNEQARSQELIQRLLNGIDIALITDAGTPCISDPGHILIRKAAEHQILILPIPGCSAAIAGISASGIPTDRFMFIGFLPRKQKKRKQVLDKICEISTTAIFYESPKRIRALLKELADHFGNIPAFLAREMTKRHEEYIRGTLEDILEQLAPREQIKGECVLIVHPVEKEIFMEDDTLTSILMERMEQQPSGTSQMAAQISRQTGLPKKQVYHAILKLKKKR